MIPVLVTPYAFRGSIVRIGDAIRRFKDLGYESIMIADPNFHAHVVFNETARQAGLLPIHAIVKGKKILIAKNKTGFRSLVRFHSGESKDLEGVLVKEFKDFRPVMYLSRSERRAYEIMKAILDQKPVEGDFSLTKKETDPSVLGEFEVYDLREKQTFPKPGDNFFNFGNLSEERRKRLKKEIKLVKEKGFESYFAAVKKIVDKAKELGIKVGPGRGSAVGSLLAFLLGITQVDPLQYGLLFERFINEGRKELPDIDIDVEDVRRRELIKALSKEFRFVSLVSTFATLKDKALRNAFRKIGIRPTKRVQELLRELPVKRSIHAAGVIVSDSDTTLPYYVDEDLKVCEYDMDSLKMIGVEKIDILGLKTLSFIRELERKTSLHSEEIPLDDEQVYESISKGMTSGVFQLESEEARKIARIVAPKKMVELSHVLAINRPGPLKTGLHQEYLKRRIEGGWRSLKGLEDVLNETLGLPIYQEQIMVMAVRLSGMSLSEADLLRKAVAKKDPELMERSLKRLEEGMKELGHDSAFIKDTLDLIKEFASYAFNKSHSVAYSHLSYWLSYYKEKFFPQFLLAFIDFNPSETEKIMRLVQEGICRGYKILNPDVNEPLGNFYEKTIRLPLHVVKGIGKELSIKAHEKGPFSSVSDFSRKVMSGAVVENLIKAGAFDSLYSARKEALRALKTGDIPKAALKIKEKFGKIEKEATSEDIEDRAFLENDSLGFPLTIPNMEETDGAKLCEVVALSVERAVKVRSFGKGLISDGRSVAVLREELPKGDLIVVLNGDLKVLDFAFQEEIAAITYDCGIFGIFADHVKIPADCKVFLKKVK